MTGATIRMTAELLGANRLGLMFGELLLRGENMLPAMDEIGAAMVDSTHQHFASGVGPDGTPWKPSIRAAAEGGKTLVDSRRLENSITHAANATSVEIGTNMIYAGIHQFGGRIVAKNAKALRFRVGNQWATKKAVTIPARPFLGISDADGGEIEAIVAGYLGGAAR